MSYSKKTRSRPLSKLKFRHEAAKSVKSDFDFGNGIDVDNLEQFIDELESSINTYNSMLSDADDQRTVIRNLERQANDVSDRLLSLVGGSYGKDSQEYQRIGGVRKSEIDYSGTRPETYTEDGEEEEESPEPDGGE